MAPLLSSPRPRPRHSHHPQEEAMGMLKSKRTQAEADAVGGFGRLTPPDAMSKEAVGQDTPLGELTALYARKFVVALIALDAELAQLDKEIERLGKELAGCVPTHKIEWRFVRCGKSRCHCARGSRGHGPYAYAKKREGKKVKSIYLGKSWAPPPGAVSVAEYRRLQKELSRLRARREELWLRAEWALEVLKWGARAW